MITVQDAAMVELQAKEHLKDLARSTSLYPQDVQTTIAATGLALIALLAPQASLGSCSQDGADLHYVGRPGDGLYVCCGGLPQHCWKLKT